MDQFIGQLLPVAFNFAPRGWALCQGQLLPISQNQALFALLGVMYGGDGQTTFALPDLRGRAPIGFGAGPGLSDIPQGQVGGTETVTLTTENNPKHAHSVACAPGEASNNTPAWNLLADGSNYAATPTGALSASACQAAGSNAPHENRSPYQVQNWIICLAGIFPSRS